MEQIITQELINKAMTYEQYRSMINELLEKGLTTGPKQNETMLNYGRLNAKRMKKWDKIARITPELHERLLDIKKPVTWLVLTEGWCGDAAQNLPFINKMAEINPLINLKLILRDENLEVMDEYLTDGGRSIPKLIVLDAENLSTLGTWGPRPAPMQKLVMDNKVTKEKNYGELNEVMHLWYAKDRGITLQNEILAILGVWNKKQQSLPVQAV
ncbi:MAG: thioredoxin family protein [Roseivirga sp.]|nr:thioredoxin family protein [Roseivirga sp.]